MTAPDDDPYHRLAAHADEPGAAQAAGHERRFGGLARLYGAGGAARIAGAHVAVVGIGGVGSWAAEALARSGVGRLTLVDLDVVSESNINRQIHALGATVGQAKVEAMRARIADINPACDVRAVDDFATPENWPALLGGRLPDAVIDACDQMSAKVALAAWALAPSLGRAGLFVTIGAAGGKRHAERVELADLGDVTHDPLLARLRQRLRHEHGAPAAGRPLGIRCVFSREPVTPPGACDAQAGAVATPHAGDGSLNCQGYGSSVAVTATFGFAAAGWVMQRMAAA